MEAAKSKVDERVFRYLFDEFLLIDIDPTHAAVSTLKALADSVPPLRPTTHQPQHCSNELLYEANESTPENNNNNNIQSSELTTTTGHPISQDYLQTAAHNSTARLLLARSKSSSDKQLLAAVENWGGTGARSRCITGGEGLSIEAMNRESLGGKMETEEEETDGCDRTDGVREVVESPSLESRRVDAKRSAADRREEDTVRLDEQQQTASGGVVRYDGNTVINDDADCRRRRRRWNIDNNTIEGTTRPLLPNNGLDGGGGSKGGGVVGGRHRQELLSGDVISYDQHDGSNSCCVVVTKKREVALDEDTRFDSINRQAVVVVVTDEEREHIRDAKIARIRDYVSSFYAINRSFISSPTSTPTTSEHHENSDNDHVGSSSPAVVGKLKCVSEEREWRVMYEGDCCVDWEVVERFYYGLVVATAQTRETADEKEGLYQAVRDSLSGMLLQVEGDCSKICYPSQLRFIPILLENSLICESLDKAFIEGILSCVARLSESSRFTLIRWYHHIPLKHLRRHVITIQHMLTIHLLHCQCTGGFEGVFLGSVFTSSAVAMLKILYRANVRRETKRLAKGCWTQSSDCLNYTEFYNDAFNTMQKLISYDFSQWVANDSADNGDYTFGLLANPFIVDAANKANILKKLAGIQQNHQARQAVWNSLPFMLLGISQTGPAPYLVLNIRRDHIIQDALHQLAGRSNLLHSGSPHPSAAPSFGSAVATMQPSLDDTTGQPPTDGTSHNSTAAVAAIGSSSSTDSGHGTSSSSETTSSSGTTSSATTSSATTNSGTTTTIPITGGTITTTSTDSTTTCATTASSGGEASLTAPYSPSCCFLTADDISNSSCAQVEEEEEEFLFRSKNRNIQSARAPPSQESNTPQSVTEGRPSGGGEEEVTNKTDDERQHGKRKRRHEDPRQEEDKKLQRELDGAKFVLEKTNKEFDEFKAMCIQKKVEVPYDFDGITYYGRITAWDEVFQEGESDDSAVLAAELFFEIDGEKQDVEWDTLCDLFPEKNMGRKLEKFVRTSEQAKQKVEKLRKMVESRTNKIKREEKRAKKEISPPTITPSSTRKSATSHGTGRSTTSTGGRAKKDDKQANKLDQGDHQGVPSSCKVKTAEPSRGTFRIQLPPRRGLTTTSPKISAEEEIVHPRQVMMEQIKGSKEPPSILLDQGSIMVVYKPSGWKCSGGTANGRDNFNMSKEVASVRTVSCLKSYLYSQEILRYTGSDNCGRSNYGIIQMLDKHTSGCLLVATRDTAYKNMCTDFYVHKNVVCEYYVLFHGVMEEKRALDQRIITDTMVDMSASRISPEGLPAVTYIIPLARFKHRDIDNRSYTLARCITVTARTHQLRVHLGSTGHPVVGDSLYGTSMKEDESWCKRSFVHLAKISFPILAVTRQAQAVLPDDLLAALSHLSCVSCFPCCSSAFTESLKRICSGEVEYIQQFSQVRLWMDDAIALERFDRSLETTLERLRHQVHRDSFSDCGYTCAHARHPHDSPPPSPATVGPLPAKVLETKLNRFFSYFPKYSALRNRVQRLLTDINQRSQSWEVVVRMLQRACVDYCDYQKYRLATEKTALADFEAYVNDWEKRANEEYPDGPIVPRLKDGRLPRLEKDFHVKK
eukprot:GHVS01090342.1.p1 GENE.GHVS01090342.1~~GHVS01090342.1.p1  ORF type:complete len:1606 (+),score=335.70 GHVS01090342.1:421-5238(+)